MNTDKIAITGISGSGKSYYARILSKILKLPCHHMDSFFWKENWELASDKEWQITEQAILKNDKWIIEGYIDQDYPQRLDYAQTIIFLDFSGFYCTKNIIKRWKKHKSQPRPELASGCFEQLNLNFLKTVFLRKERQEILYAIEKTKARSKTLIFKHPRDVKKWINKNLCSSVLICG